MTTVINNPNSDSGSGAGTAVLVVVIIALLVVFFVYGLPRIRGEGTTVNVPDKIEVNTGGQGQ